MSCNVIGEYVDNTKKIYLSYAKKIMGKYFDREVFDSYLNVYIDARYYHEFEEVRTTIEANINYYLNKVYEKNPSKTSKFILELFKMFYYIDGIKEFKNKDDFKDYVKELDQIRAFKLNIDDDSFVREFSKMVLDNKKKRQKFIDEFDTLDFYLNARKIVHKNIYDITLGHQVEIPDIFSKRAIERVYNSGLINEDKIFIEYYLVNKNLLEDIIGGNFENKYLVEFCTSIIEKKEKKKKLFNIMDNDISKECISIKINYKDFILNKDIIYDYMREGFQFSVVIDDYFRDNVPDLASLDIFSYIIISNDGYKIKGLDSKDNVLLVQEVEYGYLYEVFI